MMTDNTERDDREVFIETMDRYRESHDRLMETIMKQRELLEKVSDNMDYWNEKHRKREAEGEAPEGYVKCETRNGVAYLRVEGVE
jgi:hypothetical protein